jgi:hypothetical protein
MKLKYTVLRKSLFSCVVQGVPFLAVLLPVCVVLLGNIVVLIFVHKRIIDCSKLSKDLKSKKNKGFINVRIAFHFLFCSA